MGLNLRIRIMKQVFLAIVLIAIPVAMFGGYEFYAASTAVAAESGLGDLSNFKAIIADVQALVDKGDIARGAKRITDYETAWDGAETAIRPLNQTQWGNIDSANDAAFSSIRKSKPDPAAVKDALATLMATLNDPSKAP
jgi:hypothetical protein